MSSSLKLGLIGLDTSHCTAFTALLNNPADPFHIPGATVVAGYPGGSPDFELSASRVQGFTERLEKELGVRIYATPEEVAAECDALLVTAVDGRAHPELLQRLIHAGKPIFVDKPFAVSTAAAQSMVDLAASHQVPLFSSSSLRYADALQEALAQNPDIVGADCFGPIQWQATQAGYYWYGIHTVEMLYAALGAGCQEVQVTSTEKHDVITATWPDGRLGTVRGNRLNNNRFTALLHTAKHSVFADVYSRPRPTYAGLLEAALGFFRDGIAPVPIQETVEIVRFIEAANLSRETGERVKL